MSDGETPLKQVDRAFPSCEETERAVLGTVLIDNAVMAQAAESLEPDDFYYPLHRRVFAAMLALFEMAKPIDPLLIAEELRKKGGASLESVGGVTGITNLSYGIPFCSDVAEYIEILRAKKMARELIRTCNQISTRAFAQDKSCSELASFAEQAIFKLVDNPQPSKLARIDTLANTSLARAEEMHKSGVILTGVKSGLADLDRETGGWQPSDLVIIAGRPSMGKSALASDACLAASLHDGVVVVFSLEMSREQVIARMICSQARVNLQDYRHARLQDDEWQRARTSAGEFKNRRLFIEDTPGISPMQVLATSRRLYAEHKRLDLVCVDYLGLMEPSRRVEGRVNEVSQISRELKRVAKDLDVPVIALSQLSRECEKRNPPRPMLQDLRDSGSIEQDADVVLLLYREEYYRPTAENAGIAEIIVAKQRNGPTHDGVKATFLKHCTRFEDYYEGSA